MAIIRELVHAQFHHVDGTTINLPAGQIQQRTKQELSKAVSTIRTNKEEALHLYKWRQKAWKNNNYALLEPRRCSHNCLEHKQRHALVTKKRDNRQSCWHRIALLELTQQFTLKVTDQMDLWHVHIATYDGFAVLVIDVTKNDVWQWTPSEQSRVKQSKS